MKTVGGEYGNYIDVAYLTFATILAPILFYDLEQMARTEKEYDSTLINLRSKTGLDAQPQSE